MLRFFRRSPAALGGDEQKGVKQGASLHNVGTQAPYVRLSRAGSLLLIAGAFYEDGH